MESHPEDDHVGTLASASDAVADMLAKIARVFLTVTVGLTPLLIVPFTDTSTHLSKIFLVVAGLSVTLIFFGLSVLRNGTFRWHITLGVVFWSVLVLVSLVSAFMAGDTQDSLVGEQFDVYSVGFLVVLLVLMSLVGIMRAEIKSARFLLQTLIGASVLVMLFHAVRFIFGTDVLSFGMLANPTDTPVGGWNDLAIVSGLLIVLSLIIAARMTLVRGQQIILALVTVLSLLMLAVVNFTSTWVLVCLSSVVCLFAILQKKHVQDTDDEQVAQRSRRIPITAILSVLTLSVSLVFLIGGTTLNQKVAALTTVSHVEVRPTLTATTNIASTVLRQEPLWGVGPNRFADAWRLHKDPAINQTVFWNTPFEAGFGFIPTFVVTTGSIGAFAWVLFLCCVLLTGYRTLRRPVDRDQGWYTVAFISFFAALYLWVMASIYAPGATVLLLAAAATGLLFTAESILAPYTTRTFFRVLSARTSVQSVVVVVAGLCVVVSVASIYIVGTKYVAVGAFTRAVAELRVHGNVETAVQEISAAYDMYPSDTYLRQIVQLRLQVLGAMIGIAEPTTEDQQQFQTYITEAVSVGQVAVAADPTEPRNWQALGAVYSVLTQAGVDGAYEQATEALARAKEFAPQSPEVVLQQAQLAINQGAVSEAQELAEQALLLKQNYTDAYFFLTQLAINQGDLDTAIQAVQQNAAIERTNAVWPYQLGILYSNKREVQNARTAFERAVALDADFANARYFLAFIYDELGRTEDARMQLERVLALNPENEDVRYLLEQLAEGRPLNTDSLVPPQAIPEVSLDSIEPDINSDIEDITESDLLAPVNGVSQTDSAPEEGSDAEAAVESAGE